MNVSKDNEPVSNENESKTIAKPSPKSNINRIRHSRKRIVAVLMVLILVAGIVTLFVVKMTADRDTRAKNAQVEADKQTANECYDARKQARDKLNEGKYEEGSQVFTQFDNKCMGLALAVDEVKPKMVEYRYDRAAAAAAAGNSENAKKYAGEAVDSAKGLTDEQLDQIPAQAANQIDMLNIAEGTYSYYAR